MRRFLVLVALVKQQRREIPMSGNRNLHFIFMERFKGRIATIDRAGRIQALEHLACPAAKRFIFRIAISSIGEMGKIASSLEKTLPLVVTTHLPTLRSSQRAAINYPPRARTRPRREPNSLERSFGGVGLPATWREEGIERLARTNFQRLLRLQGHTRRLPVSVPREKGMGPIWRRAATILREEA